MKKYSLIVALVSLSMVTRSQTLRQVSHLKITILSTMLVQEGVGDRSFGALIECGSNRMNIQQAAIQRLHYTL